MKGTKRMLTAFVGILLSVGMWLQSPASAADWRKQYPEITLGVITAENEADRITRYQPVRDYLQRVLGVEIKWRTATDYAGIIEGVKAKKIELARFGPASYAQCWIVTRGAVQPLVGDIDEHNTFDAVATWWNSDAYSNPQRMEMKGMIPPGQRRIIWQSPRLPSRPWAMPTSLPEQMRQDITEALMRMPEDGPEAWEALSMGKMKGFRRVTHADYEPIVRMIQHNLEKRHTN